jgi:hypothetical protein
MLREQVRRGVPTCFRVRGFSLLPAIPPGATVELTPAGTAGPRRGELVVFEHRGQLVCHLLVSTGGPSGHDLITRGVWAAQPDPPVATDALLGVVTTIQVCGVRVPAAGATFRAWLAFGRGVAPLVRGVRAALRPIVPPSVRSRLRRGFGRGGK